MIAPPSREVFERGLRREEVGEDVRAERGVELLLGDVADPLLRELDGRVVDEHVKPAERLGRLLDGAAALCLLPHVGLDREAAPALLFDLPLGLLRVLVFVEVDDGDVGALSGEKDGDGAADAAVAAGDERGLPVELAGAAVVGLLELGARRHLVFVAGLVGLVLRRKGVGILFLFVGHDS